MLFLVVSLNIGFVNLLAVTVHNRAPPEKEEISKDGCTLVIILIFLS